MAGFIKSADAWSPTYSSGGSRGEGQTETFAPYSQWVTPDIARQLGYEGPMADLSTKDAQSFDRSGFERWLAGQGLSLRGSMQDGQGWVGAFDPAGQMRGDPASLGNLDNQFLGRAAMVLAAPFAVNGLQGMMAGTGGAGGAAASGVGDLAGYGYGGFGVDAAGNVIAPSLAAGGAGAAGAGTAAGVAGAAGAPAAAGGLSAFLKDYATPLAIGGQLIGAKMGADAAESAAEAQVNAANKATDLQKSIFDQIREDQRPWRERGNAAGSRLADLLGIGNAQAPGAGSLMQQYTGESLQNDPGYQFGMNQGRQAIERSAAGRGGLYSGATLKALQRFGTDYGSTKFNEGFNRDQANKSQMFNMLSGVAGTGQAATNQVNSAATNYGNNVSNNMMQQGVANSAGQIGQANAWSNAIGGGLNFLQQQNFIDALREKGGR